MLLLEAGEDFTAAGTPPEVRGGNFRLVDDPGLRWRGVDAQLTEDQRPRSYVCGRGVGGSSVINGQSAVRGLAADFNRWAADGCDGWSWADVLPWFRAVEEDLDFGDAPYHGTGGPLPVSRSAECDWGAASQALAEAAVARGHKFAPDANAPGSAGVSPVPWNRRAAGRVSAKDAFLDPVRSRPNLAVTAGALATRAVVRGTRVAGVEMIREGRSVVVPAARVVVCAGAIGSPAFLLRSGIGPAAALGSAGVPVVADVPGVGDNLQDHPTVWALFPLEEPARCRSNTALPGHCAVRCTSGSGAEDDLQIYVADYAGTSTAIAGAMVALLDPVSAGRVALRSADASVPLEIRFGMLTAPGDVARLRCGLEEAGRLLAGAPFGPVASGTARLARGVPLGDPGARDLDVLLRATCTSYNHAAGTCALGTVLDPSGAVRGVEGLFVADASVMPRIVRAPTHLTTVAVAARIAGGVAAGG